MTVVNNLKSPSAIAKISDLIDNVCEYFEGEDKIDEDSTLIKVEECNEFIIIKIEREYIVIQNVENTSLQDLIKLAKDMSVVPDGESITISMSIPV